MRLPPPPPAVHVRLSVEALVVIVLVTFVAGGLIGSLAPWATMFVAGVAAGIFGCVTILVLEAARDDDDPTDTGSDDGPYVRN